MRCNIILSLSYGIKLNLKYKLISFTSKLKYAKELIIGSGEIKKKIKKMIFNDEKLKFYI